MQISNTFFFELIKSTILSVFKMLNIFKTDISLHSLMGRKRFLKVYNSFLKRRLKGSL